MQSVFYIQLTANEFVRRGEILWKNFLILANFHPQKNFPDVHDIFLSIFVEFFQHCLGQRQYLDMNHKHHNQDHPLLQN